MGIGRATTHQVFDEGRDRMARETIIGYAWERRSEIDTNDDVKSEKVGRA
jgi:hypothetical protein